MVIEFLGLSLWRRVGDGASVKRRLGRRIKGLGLSELMVWFLFRVKFKLLVEDTCYYSHEG